MYDRLGHEDDVLLRVWVRDVLFCPNEAIPAFRAGAMVITDPAGWPTWPWEPWQPWDDADEGLMGWRLAGRFKGSDADHWLFLSGADWFLLPRGRVELVGRGPQASVPEELL
jgi:hypothetical protein